MFISERIERIESTIIVFTVTHDMTIELCTMTYVLHGMTYVLHAVFQMSAGGAAIGNADAERAVLRVRQKLEGVEVSLYGKTHGGMN